MDLVEQLAKQASQISMYDIKSYYNQAKNAVLNVSEMEAKVREATNDDTWGASSTLMQEIAQGTHNFQQFNEILPLIWSRFHECEARDWRQIYKALTLLEYLVKNGSERVVDDARSHVSTIKMLRSFHYTDEKGKDQGINVRNRAKELADLLGDIERIRQERRKAKQNRNKYSGISGGGGGGGSMSGGGGGGGRYGGFGSDSYNYNGGSGSRGYSGRDDYDSGDLYRGSGTANRGNSGSSSRGGDFDQYDAGDDEDARPAATTARTSSTTRTSKGKAASAASSSPAPAAPPAAKPRPIVDLFDFDDEVLAAGAPAMPAAAPASDLVDDDDFADFQAAPTSSGFAPTPVTATKSAPTGGNVFDFLDSVPAPSAKPVTPAFSPISPAQPAPSNFGSFGGMGAAPSAAAPRAGMAGPTASKPATTSSSGGLGGFDDLWNTSLSSAGGSKTAASGKKTIAEMEREKTMASLWGAPTNNPSSPAQQKPSSGGFEDLLG